LLCAFFSRIISPGTSLKTILAAKGGEIVCIEPTADLAAAAKLLSTHRIGVLVVLDTDRRLVGVLSERDIVRALAEAGTTVLRVPVWEVMTRNVSTCDVNDSIGDVIDRMTKGKFRHMPVLDKDRLAGLVSIGDVLKWHLETIREHIHQIETSLVEFELLRL
jgi:CBS domain-containing protein